MSSASAERRPGSREGEQERGPTLSGPAHLPALRDRAANLRLLRLVSEVLHAIAAGAFHPVVAWHCPTCPYQPRCWAWA